ncbi:hypothetical protein QT196_02145 [Streptomyces sp. P9-2B-2]|uniref:hypothetical protein n=1 Tax=unclassified Streptomyces TaxID=2593676 RepID=UPI002001E2E5|nr:MULTISPECIES: hypothetical protein [unclassified Streptomyces]WJY36158.1 hypothetical protein QT196_02145 [Streptomyces sp. P9-2B-2]
MNSDERPEEAQVGHGDSGMVSLVLGSAALALYGSPLLHFLPPWVRYLPVYLTVPLGICAMVFGFTVLHRMRGDQGANRRRARAGVALGTVALAIPVIVVVWLEWSLQR